MPIASGMNGESPNEDVATLLASLRVRVERNISRHQRWIERFTADIGRPRSLYFFALLAAVWIGYNVLAPRVGARSFDPPPFSWLQGLVGCGALLMTTMILTTQNRQARDFEQRGQLELEISLLAEQKIAKLIALLEELRRDMPIVSNRVDPVAEVMQRPVDPHAVMSALEQFDPRPAAPPDPGIGSGGHSS